MLYITGAKGQTNWSLVSQPGGNLIIVNQTTGYSYTNEPVDSHGMRYTLKKSTDSFLSFEPIKTKTGNLGCYSIDEMFYIDADAGFIAELCQGSTAIYKTVDGGQTWTQTGFGGTYGLSMDFINEDIGYYAFYPGEGNDSYLMKNGAVVFSTRKYIFTKDNCEHPNYTTKIKFLNDSIGFIICKDTLDNAVILKTTNSGNDWSETKLLNHNLFTDIYFLSDSTGFVIGTNGTILRTDDYGENWQNVSSSTTNRLNSIDFSNDSIGYIVGDNGDFLGTQDAGITWDSEPFLNSIDLIYVRTFNDYTYILDSNGYLYSNHDISSISINSNESIAIYPNPAIDFISIIVPQTIRDYKVNVYDMQGRKILSTNENRIDLESIESGVYLIIVIANNQTYNTKLIKQ